MGYTHYWEVKVPRGFAKETEATYQKAIKECERIVKAYSNSVGGLSGYSAHAKNYSGIKFNGSERTGSCEDFMLREHIKQNKDGNFCKTRQYPYDVVVVACLIVMHHRLGTAFRVFSDGLQHDYAAGLFLAQGVLKNNRLRIPLTINKSRERMETL